LLEHHAAGGHHLQSYWLFLLRIDKPWFLTEGKACCCAHHTFRLGFPNCLAIIIIINYIPAIMKNLVSSCMDPLNECVLYGSFENPARLLMRMCAELYSFYQKIDTKHCTLQQHILIRSKKCKELFQLT
jgi:hypothetical protein